MALRVEQGSNYRSVREPYRPEGGLRLALTAVNRYQLSFVPQVVQKRAALRFGLSSLMQ